MIYTVTLNPAVDRELSVKDIEFNNVIRANDCRIDCGGKGFNVARMLKELSTPSIALGLAGGKSGELLEKELNKLGIKTDFVWITGETRTNISIVESNNSRHIKINEPGPTVSTEELDALTEKIRISVKPGDWWVLAGSLPPGVPSNIYAKFIEIIEKAGAHTVLDTSGEALRLGCKANPFLVKPNAEEAIEILGTENEFDNIQLARGVHELGAKNIIISMGKDGAMLLANDLVNIVSSPKIVELNPTGAGDAMVGGLVSGLNIGKTIAEALQIGIACGAATASQHGTNMGSHADVIKLISQIQSNN